MTIFELVLLLASIAIIYFVLRGNIKTTIKASLVFAIAVCVFIGIFAILDFIVSLPMNVLLVLIIIILLVKR